MNKKEYDPAALLQHIKHGEENAISMAALASLMGISDRELRKRVFDARRQGIPILSGQLGYWLSDDPGGREELAFIKKRQKAGKSTFASVQHLVKRQQAAGQSKGGDC